MVQYKKEKLIMTTTVIHNDDSISTRLFAKWISDRYTFSVDKYTKIQNETVQSIIEDKKFTKIVKLDGVYTNYLAINDDAMIVITQKAVEDDMEEVASFFELFAKDIDTFDVYYNFIIELDENTNKDKILVEYHSFSLGDYSDVRDNIEYFKKELFLNVQGDVYEPYLDVDMLFDSFLASKAPILQLTGKPGLGKSKLITLFVKHLLSSADRMQNIKNIKIARPTHSSVLASEDFWIRLRQGNFHALILDDIDYILQERNEQINSTEDKSHNDIVNKMLTFTDGLFHQKTKILITTNVLYSKIDKALSRDFRLFDSLELRALNYEEALLIWKQRFGLKQVDFNKLYRNVDEITPASLSQEAEKILNQKVNVEEKKTSYCKEEGISKLASLRKPRNTRVGF
jgi:hypothetical protein